MNNWLDYDSCIKADSVRKWMQSVVDKARKNLQSDKKWELIQVKLFYDKKLHSPDLLNLCLHCMEISIVP